MSVESLLLIRCKQTIEELNSVITSQKHDIERQQKMLKKTNKDLEDKEITRLSMIEEQARLKRQIVEDRLDYEREINQLKLEIFSLKKSGQEKQLEIETLIKQLERLTVQNREMHQQIDHNHRMGREWEVQTRQIAQKIQQMDLDRQTLLKDIQLQRNTANRQAQILKAQVSQLRSQLQILNRKNIDLEQIVKNNRQAVQQTIQLRDNVGRLTKEATIQNNVLLTLEQQNLKLTHLVKQLKVQNATYEQQIILLKQQLRRSTIVPFNAQPHTSLPPRPSSCIKPMSKYRSQRSDQNAVSNTRRSASKQPQSYPSQPLSQPPSSQTSRVKKKLQYTEDSTSNKRTLQKLNKLQKKVKKLMHGLRK